MSSLEFDVDTSELGDATKALRSIERTLPTSFKRAKRDVARDLAKEAQKKVREEPSKKAGPGPRGLRRDIARGVGVVEIEGGYRIYTSMPDEDEAIIPRGMDDRRRGWRHPVFGNRNNWVTQRGEFSWFMETMQDGRDMLEEKFTTALEDAADKVDRAVR
jgi:hypothetical protein